MTDAPAPSPPSSPPVPAAGGPPEGSADAVAELRKEGYTMGLYVAICLLAALIALPSHQHDDAEVEAIIWGVTIGLALAHWFAFRVSATLVSDGRVRRRDLNAASAQLVGAVVVATLASIPVLLLPQSAEFEAAELTLAAFIGLVGYAVARGGGAGRLRSAIWAVVVLGVAVLIAILKNALVSH